MKVGVLQKSTRWGLLGEGGEGSNVYIFYFSLKAHFYSVGCYDLENRITILQYFEGHNGSYKKVTVLKLEKY